MDWIKTFLPALMSAMGILVTIAIFLLNTIKNELKSIRSEIKEAVAISNENSARIREITVLLNSRPCMTGKQCKE